MLIYTSSDLSTYLQDKKEHLDDLKASSLIYTQSECLSLIDFVIDALVRLPHVLSEQTLLEVVLLKVIGAHGSKELSSTPKEIKPPLKQAPAKVEPSQVVIDPVSESPALVSPTPIAPVEKNKPDALPPQNLAAETSAKSAPITETPIESTPSSQEDERSPELKAKHDALIRFAAVELEANLQTRSS